MLDAAQRADLVALLAWYRDMGVDAVLDETSTDWFGMGQSAPGAHVHMTGDAQPSGAAKLVTPARSPGTSGPGARTPGEPSRLMQRPEPQPVMPATRQFSGAAPDDATMAARQAARSASTLAALQEALARFDGCGLKATAKNLC